MRPGLMLPALLLLPLSAHAADKAACDLITAQEASTILGVATKPGPALSPMYCSMTATAGQAHLMVLLRPEYPDDPSAEIKALQISSNMDRSHPPVELVSGVGTHALFAYSATGDFTMMAWTKSRMVEISVIHGSGPTTPARKAAMIDEMKKMISRL